MSYTASTDFVALLRSTAAGVRLERMPGLDWAVAALARANLITLFVGPTAPIVNPSTTVWLIPATPSWSAEGVVMLWNSTLGQFQVATPTLWSNLIAAPFISLIPAPSNAVPLVDAAGGSIGVSTLYSRADHVHPTDTSRAPTISPAFTGTPTAPTPTIGDNSTLIATTAFVQETAGVVPPIGTLLPYSGNTAPSANYVIANGQAISRVTFAALFAITGITFGSGDGVTTFNVPDLRGRVIAGVDGGANRLTTTTMSSQALGGTGGAETETLTLSQLPTGITSPVTVTSGAAFLTGSFNTFSNGTGATLSAPQSSTSSFAAVSSSGTATSNNTSGSPHVNVQPTMELQYLIRVS